MPKNKIDITKEVMQKIDSGQVKMKPRWVFVVGSVFLTIGVFGAYVVSVFLVSLMSFSLRAHGPMGNLRLQQLLTSFPVWAIGLAFAGLFLGIVLLKRFDFSYKKDFRVIALVFVMSVFFFGWLVNYFGIDQIWSKRSPVRRLYQQYDGARHKVLPWRSGERVITDDRFERGKGYRYNGY